MWKRKARTIFTMMGVIIGCLAIFIISSITNGFEKYLTTSMESMMDTSIINVYPNYSTEGDTNKKENVITKITDKEVKELIDSNKFEDVIPKRYVYSPITYGIVEYSTRMLGKDDFSGSKSVDIIVGKIPSKRTKEVILGYNVAKELLGYEWDAKVRDVSEFEELVGKRIKLGGKNYITDEKGNKIKEKEHKAIIVGVLSELENSYSYEIIGSNKFVEDIIKSDIFGNEEYIKESLTTYESVDLKVKDKSKLAEDEQYLQGIGYRTQSAKEFENQTKGIIMGVNVVLGALAGISLLVAALGITNTMDMAIYERNKEIGVIKVIGGSVRDVIKIFVGEACAISIGGGVISVVLGFILTFIINIVGRNVTANLMGAPIDKIAVPSLTLVIGIFIFCGVIGFISGILPAKKAAKTDIITAIR